jgi:hypothetical protein
VPLPQTLFREENSLAGNICFCVVCKRDNKKYKDYEVKKIIAVVLTVLLGCVPVIRLENLDKKFTKN